MAFTSPQMLSAGEKSIFVFGILERETIEPVGVHYLSATTQDGGITRTYLLAFEENIVDIESLRGRAALLELSPLVTPAPQTGSLYPVLRITLFPKISTWTGTLRVNVAQGGYRTSLAVSGKRFKVKVGEKGLRKIEKLGIGEHENITVVGANNENEIAAEDIK